MGNYNEPDDMYWDEDFSVKLTVKENTQFDCGGIYHAKKGEVVKCVFSGDLRTRDQGFLVFSKNQARAIANPIISEIWDLFEFDQGVENVLPKD